MNTVTFYLDVFDAGLVFIPIDNIVKPIRKLSRSPGVYNFLIFTLILNFH